MASWEAVGKLTCMNPHILEIFRRSFQAGSAHFPPGHRIQDALRWDSYFNYYEIDSRLNYIFKISVAMISAGQDVVRVKQTINLDGMGLHRKHEAAFAFQLDALEDVHVDTAPNHPGIRNMSLPYSSSLECPGDPAAVHLSFNTPVQVRRWSCMPITAGVVEQELALFDIALWYTSKSVASFVREELLLARDEWLASPHADSRSSTGVVIPAPQFAEIPASPPGGISRGY